MLAKIVSENWLTAKAVFGLYPARGNNEDIVLYADESRTTELARWIGLRQQIKQPQGRFNTALADFVGENDYAGAFAVTAGLGIEDRVAEFEAAHDDYSAIMLKALADRFAEAAAEWLHRKVRTEFWGYAKDEKLDNDALIAEKYQGIRPAPGYPACPDHTAKRELFALLDAPAIGMGLTESRDAGRIGVRLLHRPPGGQLFRDPENRPRPAGRLGGAQGDAARRGRTLAGAAAVGRSEKLLGQALPAAPETPGTYLLGLRQVLLGQGPAVRQRFGAHPAPGRDARRRLVHLGRLGHRAAPNHPRSSRARENEPPAMPPQAGVNLNELQHPGPCPGQRRPLPENADPAQLTAPELPASVDFVLGGGSNLV
jgi:hypothetical protein